MIIKITEIIQTNNKIVVGEEKSFFLLLYSAKTEHYEHWTTQCINKYRITYTCVEICFMLRTMMF